MRAAQLAQGLSDFLRNPVNSHISIGKWTRINGGGGSISDYSADFNNKGIIYRFRIWITNGKDSRYPTPRWYITVSNETPKIKLEIHNIDLHNKSNHQDVSVNESILNESGNRLGISVLTGRQIAHIDNRVNSWEKKAIEDIFDHEIHRETHKRSIKPSKPSVSIITNAKTPTQSAKLVSEKIIQLQSKIDREKTPYQDFVIKYLYEMLRNEDREFLKTAGIRRKIIESMVRHYPEVTCDNKLTRKNNKLRKAVFKWSEKAVVQYDKDGSFHTEHIVPVDVIIKKLFGLPSDFERNDIVNIFDETGYEIIIISPEEKRILDAPGGQYKSKGTRAERITAAGITIQKETESNTLFTIPNKEK